MEEVKKVEEPQKPKFDPSKSYQWNDGDIFYLKGREFGALINNLKAIATSEVAQIFRTIDRLIPILNDVLATQVSAGIAKEIIIPPQVPDKSKEEVKKTKTSKK